MVFYFTSNVVDPPAFIYVGKDKVESSLCPPPLVGGITPLAPPPSDQRRRKTANIHVFLHLDEELIKHGWDEDIWFHADKLSSAHIYLRMGEGDSWENIPEDLLNDCAQLTKANSIEGMPPPKAPLIPKIRTIVSLCTVFVGTKRKARNVRLTWAR